MLIAGSAGDAYGLQSFSPIHLDLAEKWLPTDGRSVAADVNGLPFADNSLGSIICVGSVINYTSAFEAISEFYRVLRPGGRLVLEFEGSESLEYLGNSAFRAHAHPVSTFYQGTDELLWVYSRNYIRRALIHTGMKVIREEGFHSLTPLWGINKLSSRWRKLALIADEAASALLSSVIASNVLVISEKIPRSP